MKMILIPILVLLTIPVVLATMNCTISSAPCLGTDVFHMSDGTNAHAEQANESTYSYKVCCTGTTLTVDCTDSKSVGVINLSSSTNAHLEQTNQSDYAYSVCLTPALGTLSCGYSTSACAQACLGRISGATNAHIENCTAANYGTYICCNHTAPSVPTPPGGGGGGGGGDGTTTTIKVEGCEGTVIDGICQPADIEQKTQLQLNLLQIILVLLVGIMVYSFVEKTVKMFKGWRNMLIGKLKNKDRKKKGEQHGS